MSLKLVVSAAWRLLKLRLNFYPEKQESVSPDDNNSKTGFQVLKKVVGDTHVLEGTEKAFTIISLFDKCFKKVDKQIAGCFDNSELFKAGTQLKTSCLSHLILKPY